MTPAQQKEAARIFAKQWQQRIAKGEVFEKSHCQQFWNALLDHVLGIPNETDNVETRNFEKPVKLPGNKNWIDLYLPNVRVLIEQKTPGERLDGVYEQAKRYDDALPVHEKARWIITCNFREMRIYDQTQQPLGAKYSEIPITPEEFPNHLAQLEILRDPDRNRIDREKEVSTAAGKLVSNLYNAILERYTPEDRERDETPHSLSVLLVRIVFCLYAEDAGLFQKDQFSLYLQKHANDAREAIKRLFAHLNEPENLRDPYEELAFPYVNGGLFSDTSITIPTIPPEVAATIYNDCGFQFDWSPISPTIFGALFESTLNPEMRRKGGMHYTSIQNIHRVIRPLFLDELWGELRAARGITDHHKRLAALTNLREQLASIRILDPACGSGNFLTESYIQLRKLENAILADLFALNGGKGATANLAPMVSIDQFYGIEINPFAVEVAKVALWIAEMQMLDDTERAINQALEHLPLRENNNIHQANALTTPWEKVVSPEELTYIIGNPPFVGNANQTPKQKAHLRGVCTDEQGLPVPYVGKLDFVCGWFFLAATYMRGSTIRTAFVSTNSICQGFHATYFWGPLLGDGIHIDFAWPTFNWTSEIKDSAKVHVVVVGFSRADNPNGCRLYNPDDIAHATVETDKMSPASTPQVINQYLEASSGNRAFVKGRTKPISADAPACLLGSRPIDDGHLLLSPDERNALIAQYPAAAKWIHRYMMGAEFLKGLEKYCLWLVDASPADIDAIPPIKERVSQVRAYRMKSPSPATREKAGIPTLFCEIRQPDTQYLAIPEVSTQRRAYIPIGFINPDIIAGNKLHIIIDATHYHFGILISAPHMAWMRAVGGRLKSDYSYSNGLVYNTFPWPVPTEAQRARIEATAQAILDARAKYPDSTLAQLYNEALMPHDLRKAHEANDKAVLAAYGWDAKLSEPEIVERLMALYQEMTKGDE